MFSAGVLYSAQKLLATSRDTRLPAEQFLAVFGTYQVANAALVLELCLKTQWLSVDQNGVLFVTSLGSEILDAPSVELKLRLQLENMIDALNPNWGSMLWWGREEIRKNLKKQDPDAHQCLQESGLFESPISDEMVSWWDRLAIKARSRTDDGLLKTGRKGERLTLDYEHDRTGKEPKWKSIESNHAGYDVLSIRKHGDERTLCIEVKASRAGIADAVMHLSRYEWKKAISTDGYIFHLWHIPDGAKPTLRTATTSEVEIHISKDIGRGIWKSLEVPFTAFKVIKT